MAPDQSRIQFITPEVAALPSTLSPRAQQLSVDEEGFCPSAGALCVVLPTQHSAQPCTDSLLELNIYCYYLFVDSCGEFYFVSVSLNEVLFWSDMLCSSATSTGSECRI